jgi:hypothetical protein
LTSGTAPDALTLVVYALDEMRETTSLLPVTDVARSYRRPWWRNIFFAFARSRSELSAGFAVQYLDENLDRARAHWREAVAHIGDLATYHSDNELISPLIAELRDAGFGQVLSQLDDDAIPRPMSETAVHLGRLVDRIRYCERIAQDARKTLTLQRMRDRQT